MTLSWQHLHSKTDILGKPFIAHTFRFKGPVTGVDTTLIEYSRQTVVTRAILYVHGYTDYFFQKELAEHFAEQGFGFFAIDMQGYGRSIRPNSRPNWCESLDQYFDDIEIALNEIHQRGIEEVVILAHSTGGLIASSFIANRQKPGTSCASTPRIKGLILNSPFLALPFPPNALKRLSWPIRIIVSLLPFHSLRAKKISLYAKTLHRLFGGEWDYRLDWKPAHGFPLSFHWLKQIILKQYDLQQTKIPLPTLMCRSSITTKAALGIEDIRKGDGVLDVDSMTLAAEKTFTELTCVKIEGGYHDLFLSPQPIRANYLAAIDQWLLNQSFTAND
ncbi:alpha/beta hydrolase [Marinomonas fungiae]|uniref:Lysophospholipase, alpha-beta hydrolase superfamily n=1 Tax=Marinomonas fungiae TaxID=1137284 RepID=A0A0K6INT3_9GAMM|nr:alpha/beta hydrolase [Marinomonas fungiae]CUB04775.1 Lysophospholipase, alpha-beta hydrolase superfamily [Marinomonas fungiae]